jgi:hypothetical protein
MSGRDRRNAHIDQDLDIDLDLDQDVVALTKLMYADIDYEGFKKSGFSLNYFLCPKDPDSVVRLIKVLETKALANPDCEAAQFLKTLHSQHKDYVRFRKDVGR